MKLNEYLFWKNISKEDFSKELGLSRSYVSLLANGKKKPPLHVAKLIQLMTNGKVTVEELLNPETAESAFNHLEEKE